MPYYLTKYNNSHYDYSITKTSSPHRKIRIGIYYYWRLSYDNLSYLNLTAMQLVQHYIFLCIF